MSLKGVIFREMRHFVGQHSCHFRCVIGQRQQTAGDIEIAAGQGKSVDNGRVQYGQTIVLSRIGRDCDQPFNDVVQKGFDVLVTVAPAIGADDARVFALTDRRARTGSQPRQAGRSGKGHTGRHQRKSQNKRDKRPDTPQTVTCPHSGKSSTACNGRTTPKPERRCDLKKLTCQIRQARSLLYYDLCWVEDIDHGAAF